MKTDDQQTEYDIALEQTAAPEPITPSALALLYRLEEILGVNFADALMPKAVALVEEALDRAGDERGAECLKRIEELLNGTSAAEALRRVMTNNSEPLRDAAARVGVSHVAIYLQEKTIRKRLGLTITPLIET